VKWCRFDYRGRPAYGYAEDDQLTVVNGSPFDGYEKTDVKLPIDSVKLLVPTWPTTFYCAGINYAEHIRKMAEKRGKPPVYPTRPDIGYRSNNALIATGEPIIKPRDSGPNFQYEGELVAVFGKKARNVTREEALQCVLGWTIGNDVSERDWQASDRTLWRAKNTDTFKPMGPWIATGLNLDDMRTTVRLNGRVTADFATNNMIFDVATYVSELSKYCTIYPGDVMWMGTDDIPENMTVDDTVEVEITGIGTLQNNVVAER
jgi:2-keto-4-pentenoate hydratase/2-oxohepta-3-ene-1,7-dioic acid hydratase in catechol pathway